MTFHLSIDHRLNTQYCTGLDGRTDIDRIAGEIASADVMLNGRRKFSTRRRAMAAPGPDPTMTPDGSWTRLLTRSLRAR